MPRREHERPYQYAFDFGQKTLAPAGVMYDGQERFVRAVHEEIIVRSSAEVAQHLIRSVFHPFEAFEQEEMWCLLLNSKNRITHEAMIYRGTINQVQIRLAEVFRPAIRYNAAVFVLTHNHPSSDPTPSQEDVHLTEDASEMEQKLGLSLLDHIIVGHNCYVSLKEQGAGFP